MVIHLFIIKHITNNSIVYVSLKYIIVKLQFTCGLYHYCLYTCIICTEISMENKVRNIKTIYFYNFIENCMY